MPSHNREFSDKYQDPDTPINIPKAAKKSFIMWLVPALCMAVIMGLVTIARAWADDRYAQKTYAAAEFSTQAEALAKEQGKRETLEASVQDINRKLDLLIYISQHEGRITTQDMKGKLSPP